jgi:predicted Ser/Thr protein kinase
MLQPRAKFGKYYIERQLGRGAMGTVFLAFDETLKRQVAIKVLESPADDDGTRGRLLREARSASALNHPNICTVYDVGEENHSAFIVMEFVDGRPLSDLVASAALPVEDAVRHSIEAADALAHAHDRGVVHRDLKVSNAMVTSSGRLKIVDFGLARQIDVSAPDTTTWVSRTEPAGTVGTPYAMAPEQVRGETADARTDVWALGVMLYEMLTGGRPFNAPTIAEVFSAILRDPPAPLPPTIPDPLREIVQRCLAKDRTRRYERAADVRLVLEAIAASFRRAAVAAGPAGDPGSPLPLPSIVTASIEASSFVGREDRITEMTRAWDLAKTGRRQVLLLAGEPGLGKTRLSMEFARRCADAGATILVGRSDEEALLPYQPLVEALTWYARVCPEADLRVQLAAIGGGAELAPLIIELLQRLPELPAAPAMNPEGQRYRLFEAVDALLAVVSAAHPILMVLDDLHWADKPTLLMLRHLVRSPRAASLCIVATYRESELARTHPLAEMLADLRREPAVTRVSLGGLDQAEVRRLVGILAGRDTPPQLARALGESTGGNPFFIAEIMRHLAESGALTRLEGASRGGVVPDLGLPEGVKEVIGRRLSRLSEDCNRTLSLAAVIGRDFDVDVLLALGDLKEDPLLDAIDEAVRARLVAEAPGRQGRFSFTHALIRETLHGELTSARRMRLHRRVGEAIEQLSHGRPNPPLADLAYHFVQAAPTGVADKAIDYSTRAGDRAADALAHEEAARFYEMALQSLEFKEQGAERETRLVDLHTRRGRSFGALGMWALEKPELELALGHLNPADVAKRCALLIDLAFCTFWLLDIPSTRRLAAEALALAEQLYDVMFIANAKGLLANCQQADGDLPGANESFQWVIDHGGHEPSAWIAASMAPLTLYWLDESAKGVALAERAAQTARSSGNTIFVMYALPHLPSRPRACNSSNTS